MATVLYISAAVIVILVIALIAAIFSARSARVAQAKAEVSRDSLVKGQEVQSVADQIMAEPVADESAWLADLDRRLHDGGDES